MLGGQNKAKSLKSPKISQYKIRDLSPNQSPISPLQFLAVFPMERNLSPVSPTKKHVRQELGYFFQIFEISGRKKTARQRRAGRFLGRGWWGGSGGFGG